MVTNSNTTLAERLRAARDRRGWSLRQLAAASELSHSTISKIEQGRVPNPGADTMQRLAQALGIPLSELITDRPAPTLQERYAAIMRRHPDLRFAFATADHKIDDAALDFLVRAVEKLDAEEDERRPRSR